MRIIAGSKKGMMLYSPKTNISRPITDRVKESLFNIIQKYDVIEGKRVADVFAGVGSIGLEALSRGAEFAAFVEKDIKVIKMLKKNIKKTGFEDKTKVVRANAFKIAAPMDLEGRKYDAVFIDPPFPLTKDVSERSQLAKMLEIVPEQLAPNAIVTVRTHKAAELLDSYGPLNVIDQRTWGINTITFLQLTPR